MLPTRGGYRSARFCGGWLLLSLARGATQRRQSDLLEINSGKNMALLSEDLQFLASM
jgi:hypothetical protein